MKKSGMAVLSAAVVLSFAMQANAIELKAPNLGAVTNKVTTQTSTAKTDKNAANVKYQKEYQARIAAQQKALNAVKAYDKQARLKLADVVLDKATIAEIKKLSGEEFDNKLNEELIKTISAETFVADYAEYSNQKKDAYEAACISIQIADNRYKNVANNLTAPLKQIVDGNVSAISSKDELKNAAAMILGIKQNLGTNAALKKSINKFNKANNIIVTVPDEEKVVYPKDGVIGSINAELYDVGVKVNNANSVVAKVLFTDEQKNSMKAVNNNPKLSAAEKKAEISRLTAEYQKANQADGTTRKRLSSMTAEQKKAYDGAVQSLANAVGSYASIGIDCTKLGFNISKNPLIAAPLVFEVGALKDTGSLVKSNASDLKKSISSIKKINKECGYTPTVASAGKQTSIKSVNFKKITK